jgi:hypothetical protein
MMSTHVKHNNTSTNNHNHNNNTNSNNHNTNFHHTPRAMKRWMCSRALRRPRAPRRGRQCHWLHRKSVWCFLWGRL